MNDRDYEPGDDAPNSTFSVGDRVLFTLNPDLPGANNPGYRELSGKTGTIERATWERATEQWLYRLTFDGVPAKDANDWEVFESELSAVTA